MTEVSWLPALAVALPAAAVVPILYDRGRPTRRERWTFLAAGGTVAIAAWLVPGVLDGVVPATPAVAFLPGAALVLRVDALGALFGLLASALWLLTSVYSVGYVRAVDAPRQTRYFAAFAASMAATLLVAYAGNLLTLFVGYELLTLATYPLVVHAGTAAARRAGRKYVLYTLGGGVAVLGGTVLVHGLAGSTAFTPGGLAGLLAAEPALARAAFGLLVAGFGVKAALVPLHGWLPDAMVAPTPVSGLLHAVAVVKSGVFGLARVVLYLFGPEGVEALGAGLPLAVVAAVTMTLAGLLALRQERLKRGLAYSTISQLSYIVLGIAVLAPTAVHGALLHFSAHALLKLVLFLCAGVVYVETHVERLDDLRGIGRRLPVTMTMFAVASAGLVGFPLLAGFVSKWYLLLGLIGAERVGFAGVLLLAGLLKLLFFWPIVAAAFDVGAWPLEGDRPVVTDGGPPTSRGAGGRGRLEADWRLLAPIAVVLAVAVAYGVAPTALPFFELAARAAEVAVG